MCSSNQRVAARTVSPNAGFCRCRPWMLEWWGAANTTASLSANRSGASLYQNHKRCHGATAERVETSPGKGKRAFIMEAWAPGGRRKLLRTNKIGNLHGIVTLLASCVHAIRVDMMKNISISDTHKGQIASPCPVQVARAPGHRRS